MRTERGHCRSFHLRAARHSHNLLTMEPLRRSRLEYEMTLPAHLTGPHQNRKTGGQFYCRANKRERVCRRRCRSPSPHGIRIKGPLCLSLSTPFPASCHGPRLGTSHSCVGLRKGRKTSSARPRPSVRKCPHGTFYAIWESRRLLLSKG